MIPKLICPLPAGTWTLTQWFGRNPAYYQQYNLAGHNGLDYGADLETPILACHAGVCEVGYDPGGYGNYIKLFAEDRSFYTLYAHMIRPPVLENLQVQVGQEIGHVGSTGNSTGPHLHLGLRVKDIDNPAYADWLDPYLGRLFNGDLTWGYY